jgi:hypothetical protein
MNDAFQPKWYGECIVIAEMPFVAAIRRHQQYRPNVAGDLPALFVVCYSAAQDDTTMRPVDWAVAEALAPEVFHKFTRKLQEARAATSLREVG